MWSRGENRLFSPHRFLGPSLYKYRRCSEGELFWARFGLVSTDAAEYGGVARPEELLAEKLL